MKNSFVIKTFVVIGFLLLTIDSLFAMRMELAIPSGQPFGMSRTQRVDNNRDVGVWNVVPVRLVRETEVGELSVGPGTGETSKIAIGLTPSGSVTNGGVFTLGRGVHDILDRAEWGETITMPADANMVYARFYVRLKAAGDLTPELNGLEEFNMSLPGGGTTVVKLVAAGRSMVVAPDTIYVIPQAPATYTLAILGSTVSKEPQGLGFTKTPFPANMWKPEDIKAFNTVGALEEDKVTVPYDLNTVTPMAVDVGECRGCAYVKIVAQPRDVIADRSTIQIVLTAPVDGGADPKSKNLTTIVLVERILTFENTYYKVKEGGPIRINFAFSSVISDHMDLGFEQVPDVKGIDVGDGLPSVLAIPNIDYVAVELDGGKTVVKPAGLTGSFISLPAGTKKGTLAIQSLNNGVFSIRRSMKIRPGGNIKSMALQGGTQSETSVFIDEIGQYPRSKIVWASPYEAEDPNDMSLSRVDATDTEYSGSNLTRIIPWNKGSVWIKALIDIANQNQVDIPVRQKSQYFPGSDRVTVLEIPVNEDSGYTEKQSAPKELSSVTNQSTKDNVITFNSEQSTQSIASPYGGKLTLIVKGKPSFLAAYLLKGSEGVVKQGTTIKYELVLTDGQVSKIPGARSHDMVFSLVPDTRLTPNTDPAIPNVEYTLPSIITLKANTNRVVFSIPTTVTPTSIMGRNKSFSFRIDGARYVNDSSLLPTSYALNNTFTCTFSTVDAKNKTGIWSSFNSINAEIDQPTAMSLAFMNEAGAAPSVNARVSYPKRGEKNRYLYFSKDNGATWTETIDLTLSETPHPILVRAISGTSYNKNFTAAIVIDAGEFKKTVKINYKDYRPVVAPDYTAAVIPSTISKETFNPLAFSTKNATTYLTQAEADRKFFWHPLFIPKLYEPISKNLLSTPSVDTVFGVSEEEVLTLSNLSIAADSYGVAEFLYGVKNPVGNIGVDSVYLDIGGVNLKYAMGIPIDIADTGLLPKTVKSLWAYYDEPVPMAKPKRKKIAFSIKKDASQNRYAVLTKSIKMYNQSKYKEWTKKGRSTVRGFDYFQRKAVALSFEYKDAYSINKANFKKYLVPPTIESITTWFDQPISNDKRNPLHCGSIIKVKGAFLGASPKVWIEASENGVRSIARVDCKVLSSEVDETNPAISTLYVQLPNSLPRSWDYQSVKTSLIVNSGTALGGRDNVLFAPAFSGSYAGIEGPLNEPPVCTENNTVIVPVSSRTIEIPIVGRLERPAFDPSGNPVNELTYDLNSDQLQIIKAELEPNALIKGTISIKRNPKTGEESIVFNVKSTPSGGWSVRIYYQVKETHQSKVLVQPYQGYFNLKFNN